MDPERGGDDDENRYEEVALLDPPPVGDQAYPATGGRADRPPLPALRLARDRTGMNPCGVAGCPKGGQHKEKYLATACRLYHKYYHQGKRKLLNTFASVSKAPPRSIEVTGTSRGWIQLAKELKIRCYRRMTRAELEEAIACVKEGRQDRLQEIEQAARERGRAAWEAWKAKKG